MTHDDALLRRRSTDAAPLTPVTSARDACSSGVPHASSDACAAGFFAGPGRSQRDGQRRSTPRERLRDRFRRRSGWRLVAFVYIVVALAAPLLLYAGPKVLSPIALTIAGEALQGELPLHLH
jgi:hypothetical protein